MICEDADSWVKIINLFATPAIAAAVAGISWMNWRTAERKRQQDLFDKRYDFYLRMKKIYEDFVFNEVDADYDDIDRWRTEAKFLFGQQLADHVASIPEYVEKHPGCHHLRWFSEPFDRYLMLK